LVRGRRTVLFHFWGRYS